MSTRSSYGLWKFHVYAELADGRAYLELYRFQSPASFKSGDQWEIREECWELVTRWRVPHRLAGWLFERF